MSIEKETWKQSGISRLLEVSSLGRARLAVTRRNGRYPQAEGRHKAGYIFRSKKKLGYHVIRVTEDGKRKHYMLHRLVCEAFHGPPPTPRHHAAHKDGNTDNNVPGNLYWATAQENINDREKHGNTMRGVKHYCAKLNEDDVREIRRLLKEGISQVEIAERFGVTNFTICDIKRWKTWKHLTD